MLYKYILLSLTLVLSASLSVSAQKGTIAGTVKDTSSGIALLNASVVLLNGKDSFILKDTRVDKDGKFSFQNLSDTAQYVLFFTYPRYVDYSHRVDMKNSQKGILTMDNVSLIPKEKLLEQVIVSSKAAAIKIKGDTTEYVADSFRVQPNASVEDLLRELPGLQIDQFGNITAQGQKVKKVLVDGEEFFSDDPTLVTRNLRADMIDKVQVFDKKSDAAAFTGIEDGVRDKTINLKIKEDKNHGIFGKAEAGAGTNGRYNAQGVANLFKGKRRMSAYGTVSNIGRTGLGSADKEKIGDDDQAGENYSGKGLPKAISGGIHYDKKWNTDKESINGNYKLNLLDVEGEEVTNSQNNLPTGLILSNANSNFNSSSVSHKANAKYILKSDTTSTFTVFADGNVSNSKNSSNSHTNNLRGDSTRLYDNISSGFSDYDINAFNVNLSWEKKLKKYGRTISIYSRNNFSSDALKGESRSNSNFFDGNNNPDSSALLHLRRSMNDDWRTLSMNVNYTEPLTSKLSLILNYTLNNEDYWDDKRSFNLATNPSGNMIDTAFSTKMNASVWGNQAGAALNYALKKLTVKIGNNIKLVKMDIADDYTLLQLNRSFTNWYPSASFNYKFSNYKAINISYNGSSVSPTRNQLMPFRYNNSQLTTYITNTSLNNSFNNSLNGYFYASKIVTNVYYGANFNYTLTSNHITPSILVNPSGAYTYRFVNMDGYTNNNYYLNTYYSKKIKGVDIQTGLGLNFSGGTSYSPINNEINKLNYNTSTFAVEMHKTKFKSYTLYLLGQIGYTVNKSSLQPDTKNNYLFTSVNPSADVYFLKKFQLHTDAVYLWQEKTQAFANDFNRTIWNAWIGRNFLKNDQLTVKLSCNDILNQNNGYARTATNTFFSENRYTTIRRFFMIGATWSFTKFNNLKQ